MKALLQKNNLSISLIGFFALVFVSFRFLPFLFGYTLSVGDNYSLMVPGKIYTTHWLQNGVLPLWNPTIFAGIPWIGDINQSILYPSTLLFMFFHASWGVNITIIGHYLISFVGMTFLARKVGIKKTYLQLFAASLWTFSPQLIGSINNLSTIQSMSWMPWVVYFGVAINDKKSRFWFILAVFFQMLGGYPQHVLYSIITAVLFSLYFDIIDQKLWKKLKAWFLTWSVAAFFVVAITAIVTLPFLTTLQSSTRLIQTSQQAAAGSLEYVELVKIVLPHIFDDALFGIKWGPSWSKPPNVMIYFGWFTLAALVYWLFSEKKKVFNKFEIFLLSVMSLSIVIALGDNFFLFSLLQKIELFKVSRGLSTILMVTSLTGSLLAAYFLQQRKVQFKLPKKVAVLWFFSIAFLGLALVSMMVSFPSIWTLVDNFLQNKLSASSFHTLERDYFIAVMIVANLFINAVLLTLAITFWQKKLFIGWLLIIFLDLVVNTRGHVFFAPASIYDQRIPSEIESVMDESDFQQYRGLTRNYNTPYTDFGAYWEALVVRYPFSDSYVDLAEMQNFDHLKRMKNTATPNWNMVYGIPVINGYTTLLPTDIHQQFSADTDASINDLPPIATDDPLLKYWSVKYYLVDTWFPEYDEQFPANLLDDVGSLRVYELKDILPRIRYEDGAAVTVQNYDENPNKISFTFDNQHAHQQLLIADRYDQWWRATVNGVAVEVSEFENKRLIPIVPGENRVEFEYVPNDFYYGTVISLTAFIILVLTHTNFGTRFSTPVIRVLNKRFHR